MAGAPFKVKAVFEYTSQEPDDLNFPLGQIITVTEEIDADWYEGEFTDVTGVKKAGIFPNNFVEKYEPEIPSRPTRPTRPAKEEPPAAVPEPVTRQATHEDADDESAPTLPATSKPIAIPAPAVRPIGERVADPVASSPVPGPESDSVAVESKKPAPPIAPKSNAFKDRIAAFNLPAAAPILPFQPGQRNQPPTGFIKKPFVAPPPSKDAYVPAPKQDAVVKPYHRNEDPEIQQRQEEDRAAAQAAGLTNEAGDDEAEDTPKPQSLKDRIALLQQQQAEQAQRRSEGAIKKEKRAPPSTKTSQTSQQQADEEELDESEARLQRVRSPDDMADSSVENIQPTRVPSAQRRPVEQAPSITTVPQHELLSDGEEADHSAVEEATDNAGTVDPGEADSLTKARVNASHVDDGEDEMEEAGVRDESGEEDEEMDDESRRKQELRERMAKMSGGMGMPGMFNPMMAAPSALPSKPRTSTKEKRSTEDSVTSSPPIPQQRMPMIPIPGIPRVPSPAQYDEPSECDLSDSIAKLTTHLDQGRTSMSSDRAVPPPPPTERPKPVLPNIASIGSGYESDEEGGPSSRMPEETPHAETPIPIRSAAPPMPRGGADSASYFEDSPRATAAVHPRRNPSMSNDGSLTSPRPPPPPPPTAAGPVPTRPLTDTAEERGESEYEGDYDTDIASSAKRKDALKAHAKQPSLDDSTTTDEAPMSEYGRPPPPPPQATRPTPRQSADIPRAAPPPRPSADLPRAPPPVPPPRDSAQPEDDYDPYRYSSARAPPPVPDARTAAPPIPPPREVQETTEGSSDDVYSAPVPARRSIDRDLPPPPPPDAALRVPPPRGNSRKSLDVSTPRSRLSTDQGSTFTGETGGQIATDLDLTESTEWWTQAEPLPPVLQDRRGVDILSESEESTTSKRGGRTTVSKDIYILFLDYSQTVITARYDSREPAEVSFEQRHEPPPAKLRQDQLENLWQRYGAKLAEMANGLGSSKKDTSVSDGSPATFVYELIKSLPDALLPVGTRAYGAAVYANLANASVMQWDEIRPGDVVTLRNAKLEGKHSGGLHQKYKQETGPMHVAIVHEWDGTKKKIRVWEQGREKKGGLRSESYRLADLKSGEVRVWRVVGRDWVGWDSNS